MCSCMVGLLVIICNWACYAASLIGKNLWNMGLWPFSTYCIIVGPFFKTLSKRSYVKDLKQFISGLTFAKGSNQPFISNAIVFLSSSRADMFRLFNFENTVEGIPLLILIYHMDNILTLHLFLLQRGTYFRYDFRGWW